MSKSQFPPGWNKDRVRRVLEHYEGQSEEEAIAEDEAMLEHPSETLMEVPLELVSKIRELIADHRQKSAG